MKTPLCRDGRDRHTAVVATGQLAQLLILAGTLAAKAIDVEGMVGDLELLLNGGLLDEAGYLRILHLGDRTAGQTDEMVVGLGVVGSLILRLVLAKLVFEDKPALEEQLYGVIERGSTYAIILLLHEGVEFLDIEMALTAVYLVEDGETFRGFAMSLSLEVFREQLFYCLSYRFLFHVLLLAGTD